MKNISHVYETPPAGAHTDWTVPQNWDRFSADEHAMWDTLFARQTAMLPGRAADAFCAVSMCLSSLVPVFPIVAN
jgi:phenylalanine-4-hydroxylase